MTKKAAVMRLESRCREASVMVVGSSSLPANQAATAAPGGCGVPAGPKSTPRGLSGPQAAAIKQWNLVRVEQPADQK